MAGRTAAVWCAGAICVVCAIVASRTTSREPLSSALSHDPKGAEPLAIGGDRLRVEGSLQRSVFIGADKEGLAVETWELKNQTDRWIQLDAITTCGCAGVEFSANPISPRGAVRALVRVKRASAGAFAVSARIMGDGEPMTELRVTGVVESADEVVVLERSLQDSRLVLKIGLRTRRTPRDAVSLVVGAGSMIAPERPAIWSRVGCSSSGEPHAVLWWTEASFDVPPRASKQEARIRLVVGDVQQELLLQGAAVPRAMR